MTAGARPLLPALAAVFALACATVEVQPPARTTVHVDGAPRMEVAVETIIFSEDMLVDEAGLQSRLVFALRLDNRDAAPTRVDPNAIRLVVRVPGAAETQLAPTSSGWGDPPRPSRRRARCPSTSGPTSSAAPGPFSRCRRRCAIPRRRRRRWRWPSTWRVRRPRLSSAAPGGPRWRQPTTGPLHAGLSNAVIVAPDTVGDALGLRINLAGFVHIFGGPLVTRRAAQSALGLAVSVQSLPRSICACRTRSA